MPGHHCSSRKKATANKVTVIPKSVHLIEAIVLEEKELEVVDESNMLQVLSEKAWWF